ncbi:aspartate aminotransferase family protein [Marinomonas rhizomae]|uniref:Adenosylmethionine-8-amino-7-oxononanoate aminotransferase n=1 Tax=Marinomonas rhizomae TaxID=491948 RepID=A0A366J933_9GAMM|nr:aspartate aminotransferase family protein [Marinomonas rhizomae]RBP83452.1 adenosylmethionine-8-amino-7-oxononanoate aminotransferase [Marinomonas rhizomae]RNF74006.1 aspartate aminotransferase family protein [Marinomonas rhizomae]
MQDDSLVSLDKQHLIHPVTNYHAHEHRGATILKSGQGAYLTDSTGKELLDAFSGLWCVNVGYGQESIVQAAEAQMRTLPYATGYFHFSSEPAIKLAAKLVEITPTSLQHVYFTLGGSDAVDSTIRFIVNYFNSLGKPQKKHFISIERGYHGSSSQSAGLTALPVFHRHFDLPLPNQHRIPCPYAYRNAQDTSPEAIIAESVMALKNKVEELGVDHVAAFFCEPVIGSGGVIVPPKGWLKAMQDCCNALGVLFVVDEVITGFGRTGPMFASLAEDVTPDLMTMAKGLTAGYAPMGAVMMSDAIYQGIADGCGPDAPVGHGYTYSAHPVSATIALEVIRLYEEGGLLANGQAVTCHFEAGLTAMLDHPLVGDARSRGLLGALELVANKNKKTPFDPALKLSERVSTAAYKHGLIFRAFADNILGFAPALCYTKEDFNLLFERLKRTLDDVLEQPEVLSYIESAKHP